MSVIIGVARLGRAVARLGFIFCFSLQLVLPAWAQAPAWWATRGVLNSEAVPDDYGAVNQGQVKHIAKQAYEEMEANLPDGAGAALDAVWAAPAAGTDDYVAVNIGQLKNLAKPFYDRLNELNYSGQPLTAGQTYPWDGSTALVDDYALANIGQVKNLFSFWFGSFDQSYNISIAGGNQQVGSNGVVLPAPLRVMVTDTAGAPVSNVSVVFAVAAGGGAVGLASSGSTSSSLVVTTGLLGDALIYFTPVGSPGMLNRVAASVTGASILFDCYIEATISSVGGGKAPPDMPGSETIDAGGGPSSSPPSHFPSDGILVSPPANLRIHFAIGEDGTTPKITWSSNYNEHIVQKKTADGPWTDIEVSGRQFVDSGLLTGILYRYRVLAVSGGVRSSPSNEVAYDVMRMRGASSNNDDVSFRSIGNIERVDDLIGYRNVHQWVVDIWFWLASAAYELEFNAGSAPESSIVAAAYDVYDTENDSWYYAYTGRQRRMGSGPHTVYAVDNPEYGTGDDINFQVRDDSPYYIQYKGAWISAYSVPESGFDLSEGSIVVGLNGASLAVSGGGAGLNSSVSGGLITSSATFSVNSSHAGGFNYLLNLIPSDSNYETVPLRLYNSYHGNFNIPISESSGAKYRKIALSGAPLSDEKPQQASESDQAREETFIDALTLGLRHDTTDAYYAVPTSDLFLGARRSITSEIWSMRRGMRPKERPDRPFGSGWSSNLAASIQFKRMLGVGIDITQEPDTAEVTDENGAQYRFALLYGIGTTYSPTTGFSGPVTFVPLPASRHEQGTHLNTLVKDGANYVFTRKFGSRLTYEMSSLAVTLLSDRIDGGSSGEENKWARLVSVEDRYGNALDYTYSSAYTLIPATIKVRRPDGEGAALSIRQNNKGLITDIWDSGGYQVSYTYASIGDTHRLVKVIATDGKETNYGYAVDEEIKNIPFSVDPHGHEPNFHLNLTSITDPLNRTYTFEYEFDETKYDYTSSPDGDGPLAGQNHYVKAGLPMWVSKVTLPGGATAEFDNTASTVSLVRNETTDKLEFDGLRRNRVIDAEGNERVYDFTDTQVEEMESFATIYHKQEKFDVPRMIFYRTMTITSHEGNGSSKTALGSETFTFQPEAGMALTSVTDFSGNTTTHTYDEPFANTLFVDTGVSATLFGRYSDPTTQTNALEKTKTFTYGANRIMTSSTDELGVKTEWQVDELGRRLKETITEANETIVQKTTFHYKDTPGAYLDGTVNYTHVSPNFLTKKIVKKLSGAADPSWTQDLVTAYVPDANSRVFKEIVDPAGLALTTEYTYDANGNKLTSKDPRGNVTTFSYDKRNRLTHVTYADAHQKRFYYDDRGNKVREEDENDVATIWEYDALNRVIHQAVDMNGNGVIDKLGDGVTPNRAIDLVTSHTYNNLNARLATTDPKGTVTQFEYDALQRLVKKTDDFGGLNYITTYEYGANSGGSAFDSSGFKPTKVTDPRGYRTEVAYDALYRPVEEKAEYSTGVYATTIKTYDDVGNLLTATDPLGTVTKTTYDALRRPVTITEAFGTALAVTSSKAYTSTGLAWKNVDALANETRTDYDAAGRPVKVIAPAVADALNSGALTTPVTETIYDAAGNVAAVINPLGARTDYTYDNRNRRQTEQLPAVADATHPGAPATRPTRVTAYDGVGNVIAMQDARGFVTTSEYDPARRPVEVTAPPVTLANGSVVNPTTTTSYDAAGNVLALTDANGHVTTNTYDALNRLLTTTQSPTANPADNITVTNEYDPAGNRTAVIDGKGQRTEFTYDGLNRNTAIKDPANRSVTFEFNALNKTARVDSLSQRTEYTYDTRHRLTGVTYVGRTQDNRTYAYDALSRLLSVTEPGKSGKADVAYTYDALGRQLTETSGGKTHAYSYDLANNRITVTYGGTGTVLTSAYDPLNRLATLTENGRVTTYGYDLNGNRVYQQLPNGEDVDTQFDPLNRSVAITTSKATGALLLQLLQSYDPVGNLVKLTERHYGSTLAPRTVTNTYDRVNRLVSEVNVEGAKTIATAYGYDKANNRTAKTVATTTGSGTTVTETAYAYNNLNQLQTATEGAVVTSFTYDHNGNRETCVKGGQTDTYAYDYENRLVSLDKDTSGGSGTYAYVYDYRTRRVSRTETSATTDVVFSGGVSVSEYEGGTPAVASAEYIRGSDWGGGVGGLLYSVRAGVPSFKHYNSRGDVISETNASGVATWQGTYEAFGTRTQEAGATQDRQKANTKEEDPTGLLNEGFRYRDLETGAFITRDPLGFVDGPNLYAYVVQNPWTKFDPEGLQSFDGNQEIKGSPPMGDLDGMVASGVITTGQKTLIENGSLTKEQAIRLSRVGSKNFGKLPKLEFTEAELKAMPPAMRKRVEAFNRANGYTEDTSTKNPGGPSAKSIKEKGGVGPVKKGEEGVAKSKQEAVDAGETVTGEEVTFVLPSGKRTRADLTTTTPDGDLKVRESKNGPTAKLTPGQQEMKETVDNGGTVVPKGTNAEKAGLEPGTPVQVKHFEEDRH